MVQEIIEILKPSSSKMILDCTFGGGGHSRALLAKGARVVALDRDYKAVLRGHILAESEENFKISWLRFSEMGLVFPQKSVDSVLFDFGLSSNQISDAEYGMSFMRSYPLVMNMGRNRLSAYDFVNFAKEREIADVLYNLGEERASFKIARQIVEKRRYKKIKTTLELANIVSTVVKRGDRHPATRTFQAIRMHINNELEEISKGLEKSVISNFSRCSKNESRSPK
jgi:16S rRNA (cytosine1402-N4)-methyltransferase